MGIAISQQQQRKIGFISEITKNHFHNRSRTSAILNKTFFSTNHGQKNRTTPKPSWRNNGTPELIVGASILILLSVDQFFQHQHNEYRKDMVQELQSAINQDDKDTHDERQEEKEMKLNSKTLYTCIIRRLPKFFDGSQSLMNVHIGDHLEVLEENVGPDGNYHYCRVVSSSGGSQTIAASVREDNKERNSKEELERLGWFPVSCLEKVKIV